MATEQGNFLKVLTFIIGALIFVGAGSWLNFLLRPQHPNPVKLSTYESGEVPSGNAWGKFNTHFYFIAIINVRTSYSIITMLIHIIFTKIRNYTACIKYCQYKIRKKAYKVWQDACLQTKVGKPAKRNIQYIIFI